MIKNVCRLRAEFKTCCFGEFHALDQRQSNGLGSRSDDGPNGSIAESPDVVLRYDKGCTIEPIGKRLVFRIDRNSRDGIRPPGSEKLSETCARRIGAVHGRRQKGPALKNENTRHAPSSK